MDGKKFLHKATPYLMILPIFILLAIFAFYPIVLSIVKSYFRWAGGFNPGQGIDEFNWGKNYVQLVTDPIFWQSWGNTLFFMITGVIVNLTFPFLVSLMIFSIANERSNFRWRVAFIVPMVVPSMVIFLLWQFIYDSSDVGVINNILHLFGSAENVDLLGKASSVKWAIRFMGVPWCGGTNLLIFFAGLANIDNSLREAATLDGANTVEKVLNIDLPLCKNQFKMIFTLSIIGEVQDFVKIQTVTGGGPGYSSYVPGLYMYRMAFDSNEYGLASAMGVIMMLVMLLFNKLGDVIFKKEVD